jgi:hypothetical protein
MAHIRHTARMSTRGHLTVGHLAPRATPCQQEEAMELQQSKLVEPQQEESTEP